MINKYFYDYDFRSNNFTNMKNTCIFMKMINKLYGIKTVKLMKCLLKDKMIYLQYQNKFLL